MLHHHPFNYPYPTLGRDISLLDEGAELLDISGKAGINLICHGHRHHPKAHNEQRDDWKNAITFICAGSFSVNAAHCAIRFYWTANPVLTGQQIRNRLDTESGFYWTVFSLFSSCRWFDCEVSSLPAL